MRIFKSIGVSAIFFSTMLVVGTIPAGGQTPSQTDAPKTLQWVERQSGRIDSLLNDAMRGSEPLEILVRLTECYQLFDAVALAGLYCTNVRVASEAGRWQCDVINFRLEKDLNSVLKRAVEARRQAKLMHLAVEACQTIDSTEISSTVFLPGDLIRHEAHLAALDLLDGLATNDLHILSQKLEHAIRTLYDLEHLARSMDNCSMAIQLAENSIKHCQDALGAPNWTEVTQSVQAALADVQAIQQSLNCTF